MALDYTKGATPLYMQIAKELKGKIRNGTYLCGDRIPTELELQEEYNVSRITGRQAVQLLEQEGLVVRKRGKGTIVAAPEKIAELLTRIRSFTEEMKDRNMIPGTKTASIREVCADRKLSDIFRCPEGTPLYLVERVRTANGKPLVLFRTYLRTERKLPVDNRLYYGSLYRLLEERGIPQPAGIRECFEATLADKAVASALGIALGAPVMKRVRRAYDRDFMVQEYTVSYYDGAGYSYVVYAGAVQPSETEKTEECHNDEYSDF